MKKEQLWKWVALAIGVIILCGLASHFLWNGHHGFGPRSIGHGPGMSMMPHGMRGIGRGGFGVSSVHGFGGARLLNWLLPLGMLLAGVLLWKKAQAGTIGRRAGLLLAAAGVLLLTPPVVGIFIVLVGAYLVYRVNKCNSRVSSFAGQAVPAEPPFYPENIHNAKLLDEWERQALKEDK